MHYRIIDGVGPFFRARKRRRLNWSKIPFHDLSENPEEWETIRADLKAFAQKVKAEGFNTITLDDLSHLTDHHYYEPEVRQRIQFFAARFRELITDLRTLGLRILITSDVLTLTKGLQKRLGHDRKAQGAFYFELVEKFFTHFPEVEGLILRIGESDGLDVHDDIRSELHLRTAKEANQFLKALLPKAERFDRQIILRTWTVGAHRIGDLIWHRGTLDRLLNGIDSPNFILSMKPGDSDFFRYLPLNEAFFRYRGRKILELQARPEYEGAGELPTFLGVQYTRYRAELKGVENLCGLSVWCQTGGWHRFRRLSFIHQGSPWVELNACVALGIFAHQESLEKCLTRLNLSKAAELLLQLDEIVRKAYYIRPFAEQKLFFRRVRIPPLLHVYWDTIFCIAPVRKLMRFFVDDHPGALREGEEMVKKLPALIAQAHTLPFEEAQEDLRFFSDTLAMILLTRRYFFTSYSRELVKEIEEAKKTYKAKWPRSNRPRFRVRTDFEPFHLKRRTLRWATAIFFRKQRGYRFLDYTFVLTILGFCYRVFSRSKPKALPKFIRESAMGVDTLFK